ncbi:MAG: hypothetical protein U0R24_04490 [Solirubrobacterales bacterium]
MKKRAAVAVAIVATALTAAAPASAETADYTGTAAIGGRITLEVKLSNKGVPKQVTEIRARDLPGTCEISGTSPLDAQRTVKVKVSSKGTFEYATETDAYGQQSTVEGKFSKNGKRITGSFVYEGHFPAEGPYPEENCSTGESKYSLKKGAADPIPHVPLRIR